MAGAGKILNFAFPAGAFVVAVFLYFRAPILYLGFLWWICFLSPLVRRLADYRSSYTEPSPILLAPYLVVLVTLVTFYRHFPKAHRWGGLPFIICVVSIFWGICLGIVQTSPVAVAIDALKWLTPVLLGFYLFVNWRDYPNYKQNIQRVFLWGVLVMGVYGVFQYLTAPEWDRFWLINTSMNSIGFPHPLEIRVWSTMNSPGPFAFVMMAGLLTLINKPGVLSISASVFGYLAFLLSLLRTAWLGWFGALLILFSSLKSKYQIRLIIIFVVMFMIIIPLTTIEQFSDPINSRLESFSSLEDDGSGQGRLSAYNLFFSNILKIIIIGTGIGNANPSLFGWDSGILGIFSSLGWFGGSFYLSGMLKLIFDLWQFSKRNLDPFINTASALAWSMVFMLPLTGSNNAIHGMCLWGFLGLGLAGKKYYQNQSIVQVNQSSRKIYSQ